MLAALLNPDFFKFMAEQRAVGTRPLDPDLAQRVLAPSYSAPVFLKAADIVAPSLRAPEAQPSGDHLSNIAAIHHATGGSVASQEMARITSMEVCNPLTPEEVEYVSRQFLQAPAYAEGFRLKRAQAEGIVNYMNYGGLFGKIGVGGGKTLLSLMILAQAYMRGRRNPLLAVPSPIFIQLWNADVRMARSKVQFDMPIHAFPMMPNGARGRMMLAKSGKRGVYVITHSLLSQPDAHEILAALDPDVVVIDEAHAFANASAARTRRMKQSMARGGSRGEVEVICLSGTMTKKTVKDYHHLAHLSLKKNCPLPSQASLAEEWGLVIDADVEPGTAIKSGPLTPLVDWARKHYPEQGHMLADDVTGFRRAYRLRVDSAPGVVSVDDDNIGCSLMIENVPAVILDEVSEHPTFADLDQKIKDVEELWMAPNGDAIEFGMQKHKWLAELTAGFYNQMVWPTPVRVAHNRQISEQEATDLLEDAKLALDAANQCRALMHKWLERNAYDGADTPLLVYNSMANHGKPLKGEFGVDLYSSWTQWKALEKPEHPEREKRPVRVCPFKVDAAVRWAKEVFKSEKRGAVVWSYNQEMNEWVFEAMQKAGLPAMHCPAAKSVDVALADSMRHEELREKFLCASISSHGEGKNLQFMERMYVVQWPRSAKVVEQMLGRLHRQGQKADEVVVTTNNTLPWDDENLSACIIDSLYIHQTSGRQKLILCGWNPLPKMYHPEVLRQRGFDNVVLTDEQKKMLADKFGSA